MATGTFNMIKGKSQAHIATGLLALIYIFILLSAEHLNNVTLGGGEKNDSQKKKNK